MSRWRTPVLFFATVLTFATERAAAEPLLLTVTGVSNSDLTANVLLAYDATLGQLTLDVSNTSSNYDSRITSFAFNVPSQIAGITSLSSTLTRWTYSFDPNDINTPGQFGLFDAAGVTGTHFNGGHPNDGIGRGDTARFQFLFSGSDLATLNEQSFLGLLSFDPARKPRESQQAFIARFQRTAPDGSSSDVGIPVGPPVEVPEPATLLLISLGLATIAIRRRKRS